MTTHTIELAVTFIGPGHTTLVRRTVRASNANMAKGLAAMQVQAENARASVEVVGCEVSS